MFGMTSRVWRDSYVWCDSFMCEKWLIHMCDMPHAYVWHELEVMHHPILCVTWMCVTWLIYMCGVSHSFIRVTWRIHKCAMTHSHGWHDVFTWVTWRIHMCAMTHSYGWHDVFTCVPWLIHTGDMTYSHVCHDSFTYVACLIHVWHELHSTHRILRQMSYSSWHFEFVILGVEEWHMHDIPTPHLIELVIFRGSEFVKHIQHTCAAFDRVRDTLLTYLRRRKIRMCFRHVEEVPPRVVQWKITHEHFGLSHSRHCQNMRRTQKETLPPSLFPFPIPRRLVFVGFVGFVV